MSNSDSGASAPNGSGDALHAFSDALADAVAALAPSVVAIHARRRIPASGIVWRNGYVIATDHTIRRERDITVSLNDGRQIAATLIGRDASTDLALLKLADDSVPAAPRVPAGDSARPGHIVLAVGRPGSAITATLGTIHATGGEWRTWQGGQMSELLRVDMAVHDGFSGSALMDSAGRVLGINSSILTRGAPATIPAATIDRVVDQLLSGGRVPRGWLGVGTQPVRLPEKVRADANLSQEVGLLLVNIASNSPAEAAGMFVGDTLISLAGTPTREAEDVLAILGPDTVGKTLTARIIRAGAVVELPVVIGESPHAAPRGGGPEGGSSGGGGPFGKGPFGKGPFGGNPFGGNPFGHHHGEHHHGEHHHGEHDRGEQRNRHEGRRHREFFHSDDEGMYTDDQRAYRRHLQERHEARMRKAAQAFEKLREFSQSFGLRFASGEDPNKSH